MADAEKSPIGKKEALRFLPVLTELHCKIVRLPAYWSFLPRYFALAFLIHLLPGLSILTLAYWKGEDLLREVPLPGSSTRFSPPFDLVAIVVVVIALQVLPPIFLMPFFNQAVDNLKSQLKVLLQVQIVRKVFELPHDTMISTPTGEFVQMLIKSFEMDVVVGYLYTEIVPFLCKTCMGFVFLLSTYAIIEQHPYGVLLAFSLPLGLVGYGLLQYKMAGGSAEQEGQNMKALMSEWGKLQAIPANYELAHQFGRVEDELEKARNIFERIEMGMRKMKETNWTSIVVNTGSMALVAGMIGASMLCMLAIESPATGEPIGLFELQISAVFLFGWAGGLLKVGVQIANLRKFVVKYTVLSEFLNRPSDTADLKTCKPLVIPPSRSVGVSIEFKNVSFSYQDKVILDDVSFTASAGATLGLCGASGCGKSTILKLLQRFYAPTKGTILVNGEDIRTVKAETLRELFSVVGQDASLFNATLRENLQYGKKSATDTDILQACKSAELKLQSLAQTLESEDSLAANIAPEGDVGGEKNDKERPAVDVEADIPMADATKVLDKPCGEKGAKLSGGQQQRVALARAILKAGCVYLLDEPSASLDAVVSQELEKTLRALAQSGKTILMVTHKLEELRHARNILWLENGKAVEQGTYEELMQLSGKFAQQVQARLGDTTTTPCGEEVGEEVGVEQEVKSPAKPQGARGRRRSRIASPCIPAS